jgi:hypothetical protein
MNSLPDNPPLTGCDPSDDARSATADSEAGFRDGATADVPTADGELEGRQGHSPRGADAVGLAAVAADDGGPAGPLLRVTSNPDAVRKLRLALGAGVISDLYVTGGAPVRIERVSGSLVLDLDDDAPLPVTASPLRPALLANLFAHHATVQKLTAQGGWAEWQPEAQVLAAVLAGSEWPELATLAGIIGTPILRRDWSLLQTAGYDPGSGLFLAPTVALPPVPEHPTRQQVDEARGFVASTLLGDFEWEDAASRANYVGLMVTPFLRRPLRCLVPFAIISATAPSSGKSLLTALIGLLVGQQTVPWPADNDKELKNLITSTFTVESGVVIFDNIAEGEVIDSPILANLLTNPVWSDRMLGGNTMGAFPNDRSWMATGNNVRVGGDIASRCVYVRLAPQAPRPEERTGFAIPDLQGWITKDPANRARLLWRLLVLVADWVAAGTPRDTSAPAMRQFTPWAHGVGGFLAHHGIGGFLSNLDVARGMDAEDHKWAVFLATWLDRLGPAPVKVADVLANAEIYRDPVTGREVDPWDGDFITDREGRRPRSPQKLGRLLAGQIDRYHGEPPLRLLRVDDGHNKSALYRVVTYRP